MQGHLSWQRLGILAATIGGAVIVASCGREQGSGGPAAEQGTPEPAAVVRELSTEEVLAGINATLRKTEEILKRGGSAQEIAEVLYEPDLTIIGEGEKSLYPDLASFMEPLAAYVTNPTCTLTVVDKIRHSGDLAVAWVAEHCDAHEGNPAEDYRIIYVFRNGEKGWRSTMEMFGVGKF